MLTQSRLFHVLLDHAAEREQAAGRSWSAPRRRSVPPAAVLENAGLPGQLVARLLVDLGCRRAVLRPGGSCSANSLVADLVGGLALLAADAFEPVMTGERWALSVSNRPANSSLAFAVLSAWSRAEKFLHRLLGLVQRRLRAASFETSALTLASSFHLSLDVVERRAGPDGGERDLRHLGLAHGQSG